MLAAISLVLLSQGSPLKLTQGAVITRSGSVAKERVLMSAADRDAALRIGADGITVDFAGSAISSNLTDQAAFTGTGMLIEGRKNVTIRNARLDGFRWNVRIVDCENVRLENCTLDRSRAIRMMTPAGRVIDHFVDIRNIEVWRTYGAGILIENSRGCTVLRTKASQAQNGILLIGSNRNTVEQCDFSFNSGWGIGLARSSDNEIVWNHADFVNRPRGRRLGRRQQRCGGSGRLSPKLLRRQQFHTRRRWLFSHRPRERGL